MTSQNNMANNAQGISKTRNFQYSQLSNFIVSLKGKQIQSSL